LCSNSEEDTSAKHQYGSDQDEKGRERMKHLLSADLRTKTWQAI